ncbi:family 20 glycosylhydrolase [Curtobacterium aurantiacum]|uniref:beta-N-acetylhexosaminidase n=1 Tax=Curtobacterium aurantiacum TaxID=3236919 RepID=A0ABS5VH84_9MICO|nr:family 20 glycosylhydrolase [Curtobacterium flaccumfaciens]MBT1545966.1 family 20 glycosylhydrolase [Curtobacterium flaccumfaciens pv. flaccumfaciens]MBT1588856.1 family 20 glycosylhydrolase [Curtobacterium flaccumfaciens pv. flaccumfaciens]
MFEGENVVVRQQGNLVPGSSARRTLAVGLAIAVSAAALVGIRATAGSADTAASTMTITKVIATTTVTSTGTSVRTTLKVKNTASVRKPASSAWLYLSAGTKKYTLGRVAVKALSAGSSASVTAVRGTPSRAAAGKYSVLACTGAYSAKQCRTSTATVTNKPTKRARPETGVMLDVARAYYPVALIKQYIDLLADDGGRFLHLHLTDDQNVGIESTVLGQIPANADLDDGVYTSRVTHRPFLSAEQARTISDYGAKRGIAIVPEIDTPGHMAAAFALLEAQHGKEWVDRIRSGESELDTSAPESLALAKKLYAEVQQTFPSSRSVHIGGDEWGGGVSAAERVAWMNAMAATLGNREVWAWNDGIDRVAVGRLDPRIHVTYWSFDGDTEDAAERRERRARRASAVDLQQAGIDLLNYNSYYLYEVPTDLDPADSEYTVADLRENWSLRTWDGDSGALLAAPMSGAAVAIWGEDLESPPSDALFRWSAPHVTAMLETAAS